MSAVVSTGATEKATEQAFFESQKLPSQKRGMTFEALFYRQLHHVTARIHDTETSSKSCSRPARTSANCSTPTV